MSRVGSGIHHDFRPSERFQGIFAMMNARAA